MRLIGFGAGKGMEGKALSSGFGIGVLPRLYTLGDSNASTDFRNWTMEFAPVHHVTVECYGLAR